ncbi:MAG: hypothetical protein ACYDHY_13035 [Acidiferrobacterales bacterium]
MATSETETEYKVANDNLRYCGNLKLAEVSIFIAITGGLLTTLFRIDHTEQVVARVILAAFGLLTSICFFLILESSQYAWFHFAKRAAILEKSLDYKMWSSLPGAPEFRWRPGHWSLRVFYLLVILFWLSALVIGCKI